MLDFGWTERPYWDRKNWSSLESYKEALKTSSTLYVGNLSFYTQESQIYALFDQVCWTALCSHSRFGPTLDMDMVVGYCRTMAVTARVVVLESCTRISAVRSNLAFSEKLYARAGHPLTIVRAAPVSRLQQ